MYSVTLAKNNTWRSYNITAENIKEAIIKAKQKALNEEGITMDVVTVQEF